MAIVIDMSFKLTDDQHRVLVIRLVKLKLVAFRASIENDDEEYEYRLKQVQQTTNALLNLGVSHDDVDKILTEVNELIDKI